MTAEKLFDRKKILVCCGSGGVGKTTIAAAIALEAAHRGKKVIVLTIDPAKRLAAAMGLTELGNEPVKIGLDPASEGQLFAMMLDTKRTFDRLIERYAGDPGRKKAILENRLYQHMSNMIAGSQEYMAMERLYELYQEGGYDLMVLDTPPTRHALDFLDAPRKMLNITGNSLLKWFLKPGAFLTAGAEKIFAAFDRLAGFSFLRELAEMITLLGGLLGGFHERAEAVDGLLRKKSVGFILVTSPTSVSIQDALYFHKKIREYGLPFLGFVINRLHPPSGEETPKELSLLASPLREKVVFQLRNMRQIAERDRQAVSLLRKMGGKNALYATIPLLPADVHDLEGLMRINRELF